MGGNPAKKYVDLITKASGGKFANWDPPRTVEVGDWGIIDRDLAIFIKEGNIFQDGECSALLQGLEKPFVLGAPEDNFRVSAGVQSAFANEMGVSLGATGEIGLKVHAAWEISPRNRAAILTATDAYSIYLQTGPVLPRLTRVKKLEGKQIVTETLNCPAFALLLTDKGVGGRASLTLQTSISEAGTSVGGVIGGKWEHFSESGIWRTAFGYSKTLGGSNSVYTPLFVLKTIPKKLWRPTYRGSDPRTPIPIVQDYQLPWNELDEDGEEINDEPPSPEY